MLGDGANADGRVLLRRRRLPARSRAGHRPGRAVHDLPRRQQRRDRRRHRGRRRRQRLRGRHDAVAQLPDDDRRVRSHRRGAELRRRLRHQAERGRHGARLLDLRRRQRHGVRTTGWPSTRPATPTSPGRRSRRTSRPPAARSTGRLNIPPNCPRCATDNTDGFVFKLNAAGSALTYSTYLGGTEYDAPRGIAVDGVRQRLRDRRDPVGRLPDHRGRVHRARGAASTTCSSPS